MSDISLSVCISLHVKYPLFLSEWNFNFVDRFSKNTVISTWAGQCSRFSNSLRDGWSEDRIPVGARFSGPFQTGPGAQPNSSTMGTESFPAVKPSVHGIDHLLTYSANYKYNTSVNNTTLYLYTIKIVYCQGDMFRPLLGHLQALWENRSKNIIIVQQGATFSVYYISVDSSTCFGCWHPSSGARTAVSTASGVD